MRNAAVFLSLLIAGFHAITAATIGGARLLSWEDRIGSLATGKLRT